MDVYGTFSGMTTYPPFLRTLRTTAALESSVTCSELIGNEFTPEYDGLEWNPRR